MRELNILHNVTIELLNYCNSSCIHCYLEHFVPKKVEVENIIRVVNQAAAAGAMQITLTGGEPLLHPNITEIIKYIKNKGMAANLLTSLNVEHGEWLDDILLCDKIGISIYGSNRDIHDSITRIDGSFDVMFDNLKYIIARNSCITLNMTIMKENIADIANMVALAEKTNLRYRLNYILHGLSMETHQIGLDDVKLLKRVFASKDSANTLSTNFKCVAGSDSLWVDVDLNVYPCVFFRMQLGNLLKQRLVDIWNESDSINIIKKTVNADFKKCQTCDLKYTCTPCIGENYNVNGDITIPCDFSCRIGDYGKCLI